MYTRQKNKDPYQIIIVMRNVSLCFSQLQVCPRDAILYNRKEREKRRWMCVSTTLYPIDAREVQEPENGGRVWGLGQRRKEGGFLFTTPPQASYSTSCPGNNHTRPYPSAPRSPGSSTPSARPQARPSTGRAMDQATDQATRPCHRRSARGSRVS